MTRNGEEEEEEEEEKEEEKEEGLVGVIRSHLLGPPGLLLLGLKHKIIAIPSQSKNQIYMPFS